MTIRCQQASPVKQLRTGYPSATTDCGVATTEMHIRHALCDRIDPTPPEIRERGGMPPIGPTGGAGWKRAVDSYAPEAAALGLPAPVMYRLGLIDRRGLLEMLARRRAIIAIGIRYAVLQDNPAWHPYRGGTLYRGLHAIAARKLFRPWGAGYRRVRRYQIDQLEARGIPLWVEVLDPLADGRRPRIPQAPQLWPIDLLVEAADACRPTVPGFTASVTFRGGVTP